ncbi:MAG: hypothetical protein NVS9B13_26370 [Candidatus Acidiferrum sp.]
MRVLEGKTQEKTPTRKSDVGACAKAGHGMPPLRGNAAGSQVRVFTTRE